MYLKNIVEHVISSEIAGLEELKIGLDLIILNEIIDHIISIKGKVIITGIGKSGIIAKKIVAALCSIGIGSVFLNPGDASHGDIGVIGKNDLVMIISNSGEGYELKRIILYCKTLRVSTIGLSRDMKSYLINNSDMALILPNISEVSDLAIPTTSSTMMTVFGDILIIALKEKICLTSDQYALYHPGGKIGLMYMKVKDIMIQGDDLPLVTTATPLNTIMIIIAKKRLGFAIVIDENGFVSGIITPEIIEQSNSVNITSYFKTDTYKVISGNDNVLDALLEFEKYNQLIITNNGLIEGLLTIDRINLILRQ
jgi:arabinose-5-phosphate isomerase